MTDEPHPQIRLRRTDDLYEITKKYPKDGDRTQMIEETFPVGRGKMSANLR